MSNAECSFPKLGEFLELLMNRLKIITHFQIHPLFREA